MITGWAGTGINDTAITMTTPRTKLYYRAGGFPIVKISKNSVSFPTREIAERQLVVMHEGSDAQFDFGWEIYFQRDDAYGSAMVELDPNDGIPLEVEHCPDSTEDVPEEADVIPVTTNEQARPLTLFASEGDCGVLAVTEEPT
jgi:hypothetical protein